MKKVFSLVIGLILIFCCGCSRLAIFPKQDAKLQPIYTQACDLLKEGRFEEAYPLFVQLGDYKDSAEHAAKFALLPTKIVQEDDGMMEGIYLYYTTYTYNEYGECTSVKGEYQDEVGPGYEEEYFYDADGRLTKTETLAEAGFSTITYEYDDEDNLIKKVGCTDGANVGGITTYTYNNKGLRESSSMNSYLGIDTSEYESQEPYHSQATEYYYDKQNRCVKMVEHYGEDYLYTYTVEYDKNSNPLKIISDDGQGSQNTTSFKYDDKGRCTEITTDYDHTVYSYGEGDLPTSAVFTRDGGKPCDITYSYKMFYLRGEKDDMPFHIKEHMSFLEW